VDANCQADSGDREGMYVNNTVYSEALGWSTWTLQLLLSSPISNITAQSKNDSRYR
jgi:hypothetical protein